MNDYGINLKGITGVFKEKMFYIPKTSEKLRRFVCEGGPGLSPQVGTSRKITGWWESDKSRDTISSYDLEAIFVDGEKIKAPITAFTGGDAGVGVKDIRKQVEEAEEETSKTDEAPAPQKKVRRKR